MTDYTVEDIINEINEHFKEEFGHYMGCDPNPKWTQEKFQKTFTFWNNYKSKLDDSVISKCNLGNPKRKKGKKLDLETRKNLSKIYYADNIISSLFQIKKYHNFEIY